MTEQAGCILIPMKDGMMKRDELIVKRRSWQ